MVSISLVKQAVDNFLSSEVSFCGELDGFVNFFAEGSFGHLDFLVVEGDLTGDGDDNVSDGQLGFMSVNRAVLVKVEFVGEGVVGVMFNSFKASLLDGSGEVCNGDAFSGVLDAVEEFSSDFCGLLIYFSSKSKGSLEAFGNGGMGRGRSGDTRNSVK